MCHINVHLLSGSRLQQKKISSLSTVLYSPQNSACLLHTHTLHLDVSIVKQQKVISADPQQQPGYVDWQCSQIDCTEKHNYCVAKITIFLLLKMCSKQMPVLRHTL